jgi:hypothetical protein
LGEGGSGEVGRRGGERAIKIGIRRGGRSVCVSPLRMGGEVPELADDRRVKVSG